MQAVIDGSNAVRWGHHEVGGDVGLARVLERLGSLADVGVSLRELDDAGQAEVWRLAAAVAEALPAGLRRGLEALRRGELDALRIDGEPEREDLPDTLDGIDRLYDGSLLGDWLGLAYALRLGVSAAAQMRGAYLPIEWQLGSEPLHRDAMVRRRTGADGWAERLPCATFSSLSCVRPGANTRLRTVVVHRTELLEGQLGEHLEVLARPLYRCPLVERYNPRPAGQERFAAVVRRADGGWDVSGPAWESSLFQSRRRAELTLECEDAAGRAAIEAFMAARVELERYPEGVAWRAGRRVILRQQDTWHGRRGGVALATTEGLARERWLSRLNLGPPAGAPVADVVPAADVEAAIEQLRAPMTDARQRSLARAAESRPNSETRRP